MGSLVLDLEWRLALDEACAVGVNDHPFERNRR
jgi:hypothetical protein